MAVRISFSSRWEAEVITRHSIPKSHCSYSDIVHSLPMQLFSLLPKVLQPQVQSLVTSSQVQPVTIQQQVQTVQAQRVLTQTANGTLQTLAPATVQTVAAPQVQQVPVGGLERTRN